MIWKLLQIVVHNITYHDSTAKFIQWTGENQYGCGWSASFSVYGYNLTCKIRGDNFSTTLKTTRYNGAP